jgi:hypothetical protein
VVSNHLPSENRQYFNGTTGKKKNKALQWPKIKKKVGDKNSG